MFKGKVFDKTGKALEGVKVSDGKNIVLTDSSGSYALPGWERANLIFVCVLTKHPDDFYRYIDQDLQTYDFHIDPYVSKRTESSFLHISDTELFIDGFTYEAWKDFIEKIRDCTDADFLIHTGDICRRKGLEAHGKLLNSDNFGIPVRYTLGNHDYVDDKYGEYTFERLYGPVWYSFDLGGTHYVCLPITKGEAKGLYEKTDSLLWLEKDLELNDGKPVVIFCHTYCEGSEKDYVLKLDGKEIDLKAKGLLGWVFGHLHVNYLREDKGIFTIGTGRPDCGGIDSSVAGCRYVRIKKGELTSHIIYNRKNFEKKDIPIQTEHSNFTSPVYAKKSIFIATFDDGYPKASGISRIDLNGCEIWNLKTKGSVKHNMIFEDDVLYALDTEGYLLSINAENGRIINQVTLNTSSLSYFCAEILSDGEDLIIPSAEKLFIFSKKSLELKKEINISAGVATVSKPIVHRNRIYWAKHWSGLYVIDRESGEILNCNKEIIDSVASPLAVDDKIFFPTRYKIVCTDTDGNTIYENGGYPECAFASVSSPIYFNGNIYVGTTFGGIVEFDSKTLKEKRRFDCGEALIPVYTYTALGARSSSGTPIIEDDTLIFPSVDGCVYFYSLKNGELLKKIDVGCPIISGITKADNRFVVCDFNSKITFI